MYITFNDVDEFLGEMSLVKPALLRLTNLYTRDKSISQERWVKVVATVAHEEDIVRLDVPVGLTFGQREKVEAEAQEIQERITSWCKERGIEVRPGVFKERLED